MTTRHFAPPNLVSRLPDVGTTIFSVMSQLAATHQAINLGQGFPSFDPDPVLLEAAQRAMRPGNHQYAPMAGLPALREVIAAKTLRLTGQAYDPDTEITVTAGATQALSSAIAAVVHPGDEVVVIEPFYDSYIPSIRLAGGVPVVVPMRPPTAEDPVFRPDWDRLRAALTPRTRAIMVNFPHNPTCSILTEADLDALEALVCGTDILLISDEVYEHIVFDGQPHRSMASRPSLAARSFIVSSFGKTVHATGWKIGYCCAPANLTTEFRKVHQFVVYAVNSTLQHALAEFMADPAHYESLSSFYQQKRDYLAKGLAQAGFEVLPSQGTFFLVAGYRALSCSEPNDFARWLTQTHGVAVIPLSAFYSPDKASEARWVRFCFAKTPDVLDAAIKRLEALRPV